MLTLYIVCLFIGGTLVAMSIFAGGDVDVDADVDFDVDTDAPGEGLEAAARFLSLRNGIFFAAFFGLTGTLFTMLGIGSLITSVFAVAVGLVSAVAMHRVMAYLRNNETGALPGPAALEGTMAAVVVGIEEDRLGKIAVKRGDRTLHLVAGVHEQAETRRFQVGDEVVVVGLHDGIARVAGTTFLA